jgi:hypothetical protein
MEEEEEVVESTYIEIPQEVWGIIISLLDGGRTLETSGSYNERLDLRTVSHIWSTAILVHIKISGSLAYRLPLTHLTRLNPQTLYTRGHNYAKDINDESITQLTSLKNLTLMGNSVTGKGLTTLTNLEFLYLSGDATSVITEHDLSTITSLTGLKLFQGDIPEGPAEYRRTITCAVEHLTKLKSLSLFSPIGINDTVFQNLTNLETLRLDYFSPLTSDMFNYLSPSSLTSLALTSRWFTIDYKILTLTALTKLSITSISIKDNVLQGMHYITSFSMESVRGINTKTISTLHNLKKLKLCDVGEVDLEYIKNLTKLESLYLHMYGENSFIVSPNSIGALTTLRKLSLHYANITDDDILPLTGLTCLEIKSNHDLIQGYGICDSLEKLVLDSIKLHDDELKRLTNIKKLTLRGTCRNHFMLNGDIHHTVDIPINRIGVLTTLQSLDMSNFCNSTLEGDDFMKDLVNLKKLSIRCDLRVNPIYIYIEHLTNLERVVICDIGSGIHNYSIDRDEFISDLKVLTNLS